MKIDRSALRKAAQTTLQREPEYEDPARQFDDKETIAWIQAERERGNVWAWCMVTVESVFGNFTGRAYLGGCSYEDEDAFKADGAYDDLVQEAINALASDIELITLDHNIWEHDRVTCIACASKSAS